MTEIQEISLIVAVVLLLGSGILAGIGANVRNSSAPAARTGDASGLLGEESGPRGERRRRRNGTHSVSVRSPKLRDLDVGMLCAEVATRLEAGGSIESSWEASLRRIHPDLDFAEIEVFAAHPRPTLREKLNLLLPVVGAEQSANPLRHLQHKEATAAALRGMIIATRVSGEVGAPLAEILTRVADGISGSLEAAAKRHAAQVGPRATSRLLGVLPLAAMLMASFVGVDVFSMAFSGGLNSGIFAVGIGLMAVGNLWSMWMIRRATGVPVKGLDPTLAMDIVAACQENGVSLTATLEAVGEAADEPELGVVARMLLLGASWEEAWAGANPKWHEMASILQPSWEEGASPVPLLIRGASRTRAHETHEAVNAAEKLGVRLVVPLGICLLPAFFALGIVPVVVSTIEGLLQ
ncbi:MAG: type II secretion system F family protein [Mobiluncus sp.]|uniref:type II secretion system F family protein n=1 Tax=Mobiluncus sp. TaxID=47293 RepID=UPI002586085A|nr:type II secretion system F family protein [Mobiluncus sp.]MCI6583501.1 type II secretion system F family protein [Mobiluncus sp.]